MPDPNKTDHVLLYINGRRRSLSSSSVLDTTLLTYLRNVERLTGAKLGCGEGGCGACTVLVTRYSSRTRSLQHSAINACLMPMASLDGAAVTTVEAVGNRAGGLAPFQQALANANGSQCGFCTPGIVMSAYAMLRQRAAEGSMVSEKNVEEAFDGNLCRCTGYRPILAGLRALAVTSGGDAAAMCGAQSTSRQKAQGCDFSSGDRGSCSTKSGVDDPSAQSQCCRDKWPSTTSSSVCPCADVDDLKPASFNPVESNCNQDLLFPPELVSYQARELNLGGKWLRPVTLSRLLALRVAYPEAALVVGNTELGVEAYVNPGRPRRSYISVSEVPELTAVTDDPERGLIIGAAASLTSVSAAIEKAEAARSGTSLQHQTSSLAAVRQQLRLFAGGQIRAVASVGGNVVTASPISDLNPVWIAAGALLEIASGNVSSGANRIVKAADFFVGYRQVDLQPGEVLIALIVPWNTDKFDITLSFKGSRRREDDIAIVSAGIRFQLGPPSHPSEPWIIKEASIGVGGMAPKTIAASEVEASLLGANFSRSTLDQAIAVAERSLVLPANVPGGMPEFRLALFVGFLFKAFVSVSHMLRETLTTGRDSDDRDEFEIVPPDLQLDDEVVRSVLRSQESRPMSCGSQIFESGRAKEENPHNHIGRSIKHVSAEAQVKGEAKYVDDIPSTRPDALHGALVLSTKPHAKLLSIDLSMALAHPGVVDVVLAKDVRGSNAFGVTPIRDELCFAEETVTCVGQVVGVAVADTRDGAEAAAALVRIEYEDLPAVLSIEEALPLLEAEQRKENSVCLAEHEICVGNVDETLETDESLTGTVRIGAQEHFYLEPQGTVAVPEENDEFVVFASTQAATKTQEVVASVLGIPMHKIVCRVKRLGGGFGGKETRSVFVSAAAAVAAQKLGKPVRIILSRRDDMMTTGTRHSFLANYTCSFLPSGRVTAIDVRLYQNAGNSADLSIPVLDRALHHCQNCYDIPRARFRGFALKTNTPSSTAFRGFGGPQGMLVAETVMEHVAAATGVASHRVRDLNMYGKHGNKSESLVGMSFDARPLVKCWDGVLSDTCFENLLASTDEFNGQNRYVKRGVAAVPTMFGISFTFKTYNQAGALVHIYHADGSVLISHGGVEMGQGLHTKLCQVAATEFGIDITKVFISETSTDKVANSSPSAASASTDMYGMAVLDACRQLSGRLADVKEELSPSVTWEELVHQAWFKRVDLSAHGFYKTPMLDSVDLSRPGAKGRPFFYYTNGAAVSVVEIDLLTGQHVVLRTSIVMDVGRSLNPGLDIGQIEGGFIQGLGWCTMEEVVRGARSTHVWLRDGHSHTLGPGTYKIPGFTDIPIDFNVRVLSGATNEKNTIHSSKAIGEPPLFLASSVFFAIRQALVAARADTGHNDWFELDSPATVERIRMAYPLPLRSDRSHIERQNASHEDQAPEFHPVLHL